MPNVPLESVVISITDLPSLNATLNSMSALCLAVGYFFIQRENVKAHRVCMISAFTLSALFLLLYVVYHAHVGSVPFMGRGWIRPVYYTILISHASLAIAVVPLAILTLLRGLRNDITRHRRIAKWTYPIWMYVSVTGVLVYLLLYHVFPGG